MGTAVKRLLAHNTGPLDSLPVELNANQQAQQGQWMRSMEPQTRGLLKGEGVPIWSHPEGRMASIPLSQNPSVESPVNKVLFPPKSHCSRFPKPVPAGMKTPHHRQETGSSIGRGHNVQHQLSAQAKRGTATTHPRGSFLPLLAAALWLGALL